MTIGRLFIAAALLLLILAVVDVIPVSVPVALLVATVLGLVGALVDR